MSLRRALLLVLVVCAASCGFWLYSVYYGQLNNTIALQRCALSLEANRARGGGLPSKLQCLDYWGRSVSYYRHGETYVLVSGGRDHQEDAQYEQLAPESIVPRSTCFGGDRDTVLIGRKAVQCCLK
jgi:hypothetical protein